MKASYRYLCELLPELRTTPQELATRLTNAGLAVDGLSEYGAASSSVVVAKVVGVRPHPDSKKLQLVTVEYGAAQPEEIVCGAPNVPAPGGLVVLAPLGTTLPAVGLTISPRKVAGIESRGMLCSEAELGLNDDSDGILVLPSDLQVAPGTPLASVWPETQDWIFELDLTPNRPDALGHIGLARDIAAVYGQAFSPQLTAADSAADSGAGTGTSAEDVSKLIAVHIDDLERCPHYAAAVATDVSVAPSPAWLRYRLCALGVRPISNVVDITNLLMQEFGHPMHAFDLDRVAGAQISVRRARPAEPFKTLDGVVRELTDDDLVICDAERPVALAGVMGGENSEVHAGTRRVAFEVAYFEARGVRRSSRRHGLHTEASHRFERGVDPEDASAVLSRALHLTAALAGGKAAAGQLHVGREYAAWRTLPLQLARVTQVIGEPVSEAEIRTTLRRLGCRLSDTRDGVLSVAVPSHRPDLERTSDLIGEVARIRGIDRVQPVLPAIRATRDAGPREAAIQHVRQVAVDVGLSEAITFAFVSQRELSELGAPEPAVVLKNPIHELHTVMRTSLVPGLLEAAAHARRHGRDDMRLFSVGSRYLPPARTTVADNTTPDGLPEERLSFAALLSGARPSYLQKPSPVDVWDAKGLALAIAERVTRRRVSVSALASTERPKHLHPRGAARVSVEGTPVGVFGPLHPDVVQARDLDANTLVVELDVEQLTALRQTLPRFQDIPRFPASRRDLALVLHDDVQAGQVLSAIREAAGELAEQVELFDRFVGGAIPKEHASLAFRVVYRAPDRTLTDAEIDERHARVVAEVGKRFSAQLR